MKEQQKKLWNSHSFCLANEEIQSGKIQNNRYYIFWIFPLRFLLNFLVHQIKEHEFHFFSIFHSLPYFYTYTLHISEVKLSGQFFLRVDFLSTFCTHFSLNLTCGTLKNLYEIKTINVNHYHHRCFSSIDFFVDVGIFFLGTLLLLSLDLGLFIDVATGSGDSLEDSYNIVKRTP